MQEFPARRSRAPDFKVAPPSRFRLMRLAKKRWNDMAGVKVEIVAGSVKIGRHRRNVIGAMLLAVGFAKFQSGDFRNRVPLIRRLQRTGQQRAFRNRLRRKFRVDAGGAEEQKLWDAGAESAF